MRAPASLKTCFNCGDARAVPDPITSYCDPNTTVATEVGMFTVLFRFAAMVSIEPSTMAPEFH
jgi:hypothetical protein